MSSAGKETKRRRYEPADSPPPELKRRSEKFAAKEKKGADMLLKTRIIYQAEDDLVNSRDANQDVQLFKTTCIKIKSLLQSIQQLKGKDRPDDVMNKRIECSLQFLTLRKLNRIAHLRCKKLRESTTESKQKTDEYHLQLLNLAYEVSHQEREITKCLEFHSKDNDIKLVSEDDFYREAPADISKPEVTKTDLHQKTLCRLHWELEQRKELAERLHETDEQRETVLKDIEKKKEHLDQLQPKLSAILETTKPVQEYLDMPFDEIKEQHRIARFLPSPLYVLYTQASGYKDACDKKMTIVVKGDAEEAARLMEMASQQDEATDEEEQQEEEDGTDDRKERKKHRRHISVVDKQAAKKKEFLKAHPLTIEITLKCKDDLCLHLVFSYLSHLRIVSVVPHLTGPVQQTPDDLLQAGLLLQCLYDGDDGHSTPNPANLYQLKRRGFDFQKDCLPTIGMPYRWVQRMAGLHFLTEDASSVDAEARGSVMSEVMNKLKRRVGHRLALQQQISSVAKGIICVPENLQSKFRVKINSKVLAWQRETFNDYKVLKHCREFVDQGLVDSSDMIYRVVMENGSACLSAHIAISPDYPNRRPLFAVELNWRSSRTRDTDQNIRLVEAEVNYFNKKEEKRAHPHVLTIQLQRLLMCFDAYLEASSTSQAMMPIEFPREKIMPRMTRGKLRALPFSYMSDVNIFTQR